MTPKQTRDDYDGKFSIVWRPSVLGGNKIYYKAIPKKMRVSIFNAITAIDDPYKKLLERINKKI